MLKLGVTLAGMAMLVGLMLACVVLDWLPVNRKAARLCVNWPSKLFDDASVVEPSSEPWSGMLFAVVA